MSTSNSKVAATRLIGKALLLAALLVALQITFATITGYKDAPGTVLEFDRHMTDQRDIIYFGDSTLYRGDPSDTDRSTTPEMLQAMLPETAIGGVYHDAYHLQLIRHFCEHLARQSHRPKFIVFPLNMRSFSPERARRPEYQFVRESLFLQNDNKLFWAFYRPLATFKLFDLSPISQQDYLQTPVYDDNMPLGTFEEIYAQGYPAFINDHVRACYFYRLTNDHPYIDDLIEITSLCKREGIQPLFYTTPLDYHRGDELLEGKFSTRVAENIQVIKNALASNDVDLLDLAFAFPPEYFAEEEYPEAYLNQEGKQALASRLAQFIAGHNPTQ